MRLDNTKIQRWKDLVDAFVKQYKYNMDIAPNRTSLSNIEKKDKESIGNMLKMVGISFSSPSSISGQRDGLFVCQHTQGTILRACDG
jgi:hypothetical protein